MAIARPLGQHWTFGHQAPVVAVAPPNPAPAILAALCCIGLILLAIAATIILSLIPLYTSSRNYNPTCTSAPFSSTFNVNGGVLPTGQLSTNNRGAFQSGLNQWIAGQSGFSRCSTQVSNANVGACPTNLQSGRRRRRRQQQQSHLVRKVRQTNNNCNSQQLTTTSTLNCGCTCVGVCLQRKVARLQALLLYASFPVTFPEPNSTATTITGINVPTSPTTTSTTTVSATSMGLMN